MIIQGHFAQTDDRFFEHPLWLIHFASSLKVLRYLSLRL